jgi:uncharacterized membrane protein (Fun14 family)
MVEIKEADPVEAAIEKLKPIMGRITFSSVMGYCSGVAINRASKALAIAIGTVFIGLQAAAYKGIIKMDWENIQLSIIQRIDTTGDGKLDQQDLKIYWQRLKKMLTYNLPDAGSFLLGFAYGVRSG